MFRTVVCILSVVLGALLLSVPAAAKPGGGGAGSAPDIRVAQADPRYGDLVTFTVSYPAMREAPRVRLICQQGDQMVYQYASDPSALFHLWSTAWKGGAADCAADLYYFTYRGQTQTGIVYLAHTEFAVAD
jgi:hypothetical protein